MLVLCSQGQEIAHVIVSHAARRRVEVNAETAGRLFDVLRAIPREVMIVDVYYPSIRKTLTFNSPMNFDLLEPNLKPEDPEAERLPLVFVLPGESESLDDGVLTYRPVVTLADLIGVSEGDVLVFHRDAAALLALLCENASVFGLQARAIIGAPAVAYPAWFDEATYSLQKVTYDTLIAELRAAVDMARRLEEESRTSEQVERSRYTRNDGSVRRHKTVETESSDAVETGVADDDIVL